MATVKPINAGELIHRGEFQQRTETREEDGGVSSTWSPIAGEARRWVRIEARSGAEFYAQDQTKSTITHSIVMRYEKRITPDMRFVYDGRTFQIESSLRRDGSVDRGELLAVERVTGS
jgi:SPP1 family predicted phage head-tail adaptor